MSGQAPNYRIGDVVNGHRWTGTTWEPVTPGWGSNPSVGAPPQHQVGEVVNGYRWNGTTWDQAVPGWGPSAGAGMPQYQIGEVVNGYRWTGVDWQPIAASWAATPALKKPWYQSPLGIGLLIVGALVIVGLAFGGSQNTPTASVQSERAVVATADPSEEVGDANQSVETEPEPEPVPEEMAAGVGMPVRDGKFEFTVTDVQADVESVGDQYLNHDAQGQFTLVTVRVKNIGDESQMFDGSNVSGTDSQGRELSSDGEAGIYANENTEAFLNEINPGNAVTAVVVFDLPPGEQLVAVEVHDSMFSGGAEISLR
jgi:hypothetical protein